MHKRFLASRSFNESVNWAVIKAVINIIKLRVCDYPLGEHVSVRLSGPICFHTMFTEFKSLSFSRGHRHNVKWLMSDSLVNNRRRPVDTLHGIVLCCWEICLLKNTLCKTAWREQTPPSPPCSIQPAWLISITIWQSILRSFWTDAQRISNLAALLVRMFIGGLSNVGKDPPAMVILSLFSAIFSAL